MKYEVLVNALNLKRNKVAKRTEIIDSSQLPNPDLADKLEKEKYISSSTKTAQAANKVVTDKKADKVKADKEKADKEKADKKKADKKKADKKKADKEKADKEKAKGKLNKKQLEKLNEADIKAYAIERGIEFNKDSNKKDLIADVLKGSE